MLKKRGLAFKLVLFILAGMLPIFIAAFSYNQHFVRQRLVRQVEQSARNLARTTVQQIEHRLSTVEVVLQNMAFHVEKSPHARSIYIDSVRELVSLNHEIFGSCIALEPHAFGPGEKYFAPYAYRGQGADILVMNIDSEAYDYFSWDWYRIPRELHRPGWSEPFFDEGAGNIVMSTFSIPLYRTMERQRTFFGIATADIDLSRLSGIVSSVRIYESGYAFLLSRKGVFVTHPRGDWVMGQSIAAIAAARRDPELQRIGSLMLSGQEGFAPLKDPRHGKPSWVYFAPLPAAGWTIGVIFPEKELFADVRELTFDLIAIASAGFLLIAAAIVLISRRVTRPLKALAAKTAEISRGNLDIDLPAPGSGDEIGHLTKSFSDMRLALKEYMANLAQTTAAKERIESELKIARTIQMSFLPKRFPPFPEKEEFRIYATLFPAREVSGDLYDFFLLDDEHLFFAVGDVSGKGVPAALFMAVAKTLLKGIAKPGMRPAELMAAVNRELYAENESSMFVTMFAGVLHFPTGELCFSNAGHNPPIFFGTGAGARWLELPPGFVLGVFEDSDYENRTVSINPGEGLLVYTDGVTDAEKAGGGFYSDVKLLELLREIHPKPVETIVADVLESVKVFSAGVDQSDDITLLALRYLGPRPGRPAAGD